MSKRILVVEDQEDLRAILRDFLSASGYTVIEAVDGAESVAKAPLNAPTLQRRGDPARGFVLGSTGGDGDAGVGVATVALWPLTPRELPDAGWAIVATAMCQETGREQLQQCPVT